MPSSARPNIQVIWTVLPLVRCGTDRYRPLSFYRKTAIVGRNKLTVGRDLVSVGLELLGAALTDSLQLQVTFFYLSIAILFSFFIFYFIPGSNIEKNHWLGGSSDSVACPGRRLMERSWWAFVPRSPSLANPCLVATDFAPPPPDIFVSPFLFSFSFLFPTFPFQLYIVICNWKNIPWFFLPYNLFSYWYGNEKFSFSDRSHNEFIFLGVSKKQIFIYQYFFCLI